MYATRSQPLKHSIAVLYEKKQQLYYMCQGAGGKKDALNANLKRKPDE